MSADINVDNPFYFPPGPAEEEPPVSAPELPAENNYPCPECERSFSNPTGLGAHRRSKHGVLGKGRITAKITVGQKEPCPVCQKPFHPASLPRHIAARHAAEPQFNADDIFGEVVKLLYPDGNVPVPHLPALIEWRTATDRLLQSIA